MQGVRDNYNRENKNHAKFGDSKVCTYVRIFLNAEKIFIEKLQKLI